MIVWIMTADSPRSRRANNDRSGWKRHAVEAPRGAETTYEELKKTRAACGLSPAHGWGDDLFVPEDARCMVCVKVLGVRGAQA